MSTSPVHTLVFHYCSTREQPHHPIRPLPGGDGASALIQSDLKVIADYVVRQPTSGYNCVSYSYNDILAKTYAIKAFFDSQKNMCQFYYNAMENGTNIVIAANTSAAGLSGQNYIKFNSPAPANVNLVTWLSPARATLPVLFWPGTQLPFYILSPDGSRDVQISYSFSSLGILENLPQTTNQVSIYNELMTNVLTGNISFSKDPITSGVVTSVNIEQIWSSTAGNATGRETNYLAVLQHIITTSIPVYLPPPTQLKVNSVDNRVIWSRNELSYSFMPVRPRP